MGVDFARWFCMQQRLGSPTTSGVEPGFLRHLKCPMFTPNATICPWALPFFTARASAIVGDASECNRMQQARCVALPPAGLGGGFAIAAENLVNRGAQRIHRAGADLGLLESAKDLDLQEFAASALEQIGDYRKAWKVGAVGD